MNQEDKRLCAQFFLEHQREMFDAPIVETVDEAAEFLEDAMAEVFPSVSDAAAYLSEVGMDTEGMSEDEIKSQTEVFCLPDGRYMVVLC